MSRHAATAPTSPRSEPSTQIDSPTISSKRTWFYVLRRVIREFSKDQCSDLAAALTYYAVLAIFPALLAVLAVLGVFGQSEQTVQTLLKIIDNLGTDSAVETLRPTLQDLSSAPQAGAALLVGLGGALWSSSGYVGAFSRAMNRVYEIDEGRPFWKLRPVTILVTLVTVLLSAVAALSLVVTGPVAEAVGDAMGLGPSFVLVWSIAKWPVLVGIVVLTIAILYYATPNVRHPAFRWMSLGALMALLIWVVGSLLLGFYVANFSSYSSTYGSLAGVVVVLLWLWLTNLGLLFGAELDAELERGRELAAGIAAEETIQLPPRDARGIKKASRKRQRDIQFGRELRESFSGEGDGSADGDPESEAPERRTTVS